jgi:hypothetical protein
VSQSYNIKKILMAMTKANPPEKKLAPGEIDMMDEITLISQLRQYFEQKKYVVVFYDV